MKILSLNPGTETWYALALAEKLGFVCSYHESWTFDGEISALDGKVIWEDCRPAQSIYTRILQTDRAVIMLNKERRSLAVSAYAESHEIASQTVTQLKTGLSTSERQSNLLDVTFWYSTAHGPRTYDRQLQSPTWKDIQQNYPQSTREQLESLQKVELKESSGKLLLWQGEPGTGKTFALRALAEEWASWCRVHYVLDPEKFFMEGDYLLSVILGNDDMLRSVKEGERPPWRLVVLEDAGEMLAKDAKLQVGQGLARLLNLCDGLLGQGLRVLVLITTNEQVGSLHEAVSRPGRCLAQINFEKFDAASAARWLEAHKTTAQVVKQASLADLYALTRGGKTQHKKAAGF